MNRLMIPLAALLLLVGCTKEAAVQPATIAAPAAASSQQVSREQPKQAAAAQQTPSPTVSPDTGASTQPTNQQMDSDPVFHGLQLGVALNNQLPKCETRKEASGEEVVLGSGLCYLSTSFGVDKGTGSAFVELRRGGQIAEEPPAWDAAAGKYTFRDHIIVHVLPAKNREHGTMESISSSYPLERLDEIRNKLNADYGTPDENNGWIHYPTPWGRVNLTNWGYEIAVEGESARIVALVDRSVRKAMAGLTK